MKNLKTIVLIGILSLFATLALSEGEEEADVIVLTSQNFNDVVNEAPIILVEFYAPWCGHCKKLTPEYAKAATELKANDPPVILAKVDATVEKDLASKYGVTGYPTLKIFRRGSETAYGGPRDAAGIVKYMQKQAEPAAVTVNTVAELNKVLEENPTSIVVVGFFEFKDSYKYKNVFHKVADAKREEYKWVQVFEPAVWEHMQTTYDLTVKDTMVVFVDGKPEQYTGATSDKIFQDFLAKKSIPLVGEFNTNTAAKYKELNLPVVKTFLNIEYKGANGKRTNYYVNRIKKVAEEFKDKLSFVIVDKKDKADIGKFNYDGTKEAYIGIEDLKGGLRYRFDGDFSIENMKQFVTDFTAGNLKPYIKSEPVPEQTGPVTVVVGETFKDIVLDTNKDVLIELYAPWCGHCKKLEPVYTELAKNLKDQPNLVIAKMDATANDAPHSEYQAKGYPTILFAPANNKDKPLKYAGNREVKDFTEYIKKHMSKPWVEA